MPPPTKEHRPWWQTAGIISAAIVPIVISAIALTFSVFAYQDQHAANAEQVKVNSAAEIETQRQDADQVSFWFTYTKIPNLVLQNLGSSPLYNTAIQLKTYVNFKIPGRKTPKQFIITITPALGTVPPCSRLAVPLSSLDSDGIIAKVMLYQSGQVPQKIQLGIPTYELPIPMNVIFTDANGLTWSRNAIGVLSRSSPPAKPNPIEDQSRYEFQAAVGCS